MLPDCLSRKKIATVCVEKKVPILPCENEVMKSNRMNKTQSVLKQYF